MTTYIDGWLAEGESLNISARSHAGKVAGAYRGGRSGGPVSYGYRISRWESVPGGRRNRAYAVYECDPFEVGIVHIMAEEMMEADHGARFIARYLNEKGLYNRAGTEWTAPGIRKIMRNPALAGISLYRIDGKNTGRTHSYQNLNDPVYYVQRDDDGNYKIKEPAVLPLQRWLRIMAAMDARCRPGYSNPNSKGIHLLSGVACCGYCGRPMAGINISRSYKTRDGEIRRTAQVTAVKIDSLARMEFEKFRNRLDPDSLLDRTDLCRQADRERLEKINVLENTLRQAVRLQNKWMQEMDAYLLHEGEYELSRSTISGKIRAAEERIAVLKEMRDGLRSRIVRPEEAGAAGQTVPDWAQAFQVADRRNKTRS